MRRTALAAACAIVALIAVACGNAPGGASVTDTPSAQGTGSTGFVLTSDAFGPGAAIPSKYTCDGQDVSPPLDWSGQPAKTAAFALLVQDPDAPSGVFTHWVVFNLPAGVHILPESTSQAERLGDGGVQGRGDSRQIGYYGPCPPPGKPHRYVFSLYALDRMLSLAPGATQQQVTDAMRGRVLGQAQLVGIYQRAR